jgi:2-polyprenyl-6-methoxyphenol hydroxylase-like FAD-dependent oxidoreductase
MIRHAIVAGGGIAGHAAALALRRAGIAVTVLEKRSRGDDLGSFLRLNPNGLDALAALDVLAPVMEQSFPVGHVEQWSSDGELLSSRALTDPVAGRGFGARFITWARLQDALRGAAEGRGVTVRHATCVVDASVNDRGVRVLLADGGHLDGDLLVGADGTWSTVRTVIDPGAPQPERLGSRTVYGYTPTPSMDVPPAPAQLRSYRGTSGFVAHLDDPGTGECYWFTSLKAVGPLPDVVSTEQWRTYLQAWWGDNAKPPLGIIQQASRIRASEDKAMPHLPRWHNDRCVVIGDAAHTAPPGTEQGAAMALEDAAVLGQCVRDLTLPVALTRFEQIRRHRVEKIIGTAMGRQATTDRPDWSYRHHVHWEQRIA